MSSIIEKKLLIHPQTYEIAATLETTKRGQSLQIQDESIKKIVEICGIAVPRTFHPTKSYIFQKDGDNLFAKAFVKYYCPEETGYFWLPAEEYQARLDIGNGSYKNYLIQTVIELHNN